MNPTTMGDLDPAGSNPAPEMQATDCLSSNATLFWRVFVPVFGTVFFTGMLLALLLIPEDNLYLPFPALWARLFAAAVLVFWVIFVKRSIWRLKRIDANATHLYVTNFWHTVRYPWTDVEKTTESRRMGRRLVHYHLKAAGRFGQVLSFLPAVHYDALMKDFGEV